MFLKAPLPEFLSKGAFCKARPTEILLSVVLMKKPPSTSSGSGFVIGIASWLQLLTKATLPEFLSKGALINNRPSTASRSGLADVRSYSLF
jgi:hypothetical protein